MAGSEDRPFRVPPLLKFSGWGAAAGAGIGVVLKYLLPDGPLPPLGTFIAFGTGVGTVVWFLATIVNGVYSL